MFVFITWAARLFVVRGLPNFSSIKKIPLGLDWLSKDMHLFWLDTCYCLIIVLYIIVHLMSLSICLGYLVMLWSEPRSKTFTLLWWCDDSQTDLQPVIILVLLLPFLISIFNPVLLCIKTNLTEDNKWSFTGFTQLLCKNEWQHTEQWLLRFTDKAVFGQFLVLLFFLYFLWFHLNVLFDLQEQTLTPSSFVFPLSSPLS